MASPVKHPNELDELGEKLHEISRFDPLMPSPSADFSVIVVG